MNTLRQSQWSGLQSGRVIGATPACAWHYGASAASSRSLADARRWRERVLAVLALVMLIFAWDATLRLDEKMSPPRVRVSHAVELEGELQRQTFVP
jgi:hypothetical protein